VPELLPSDAGHFTACHRVRELPPADAIIPSDGALSPELERLVAAFGSGSEPRIRN
jgi:hypothetical protein